MTGTWSSTGDADLVAGDVLVLVADLVHLLLSEVEVDWDSWLGSDSSDQGYQLSECLLRSSRTRTDPPSPGRLHSDRECSSVQLVDLQYCGLDLLHSEGGRPSPTLQ